MSKYAKIDELIIDALGKQRKYSEIHALVFRPLMALCTSLTPDLINGTITTFTLLDRRLQALRKRGVIEFDRENRVWRLTCQK